MDPAESNFEEASPIERRDPSAENRFRRNIFGVSVNVTVSIGQLRLSVAEILDLQADAILPLMSQLDDPLELKIEDKVIARGDLIELDDGELAFKIIEIPEDEAEEDE